MVTGMVQAFAFDARISHLICTLALWVKDVSLEKKSMELFAWQTLSSNQKCTDTMHDDVQNAHQ